MKIAKLFLALSLMAMIFVLSGCVNKCDPRETMCSSEDPSSRLVCQLMAGKYDWVAYPCPLYKVCSTEGGSAHCVFSPPVKESTDLAGVFTLTKDEVLTTTPGCTYADDSNFDPLKKGSISIPLGLITNPPYASLAGTTQLEICGTEGALTRQAYAEFYCDANGYAHKSVGVCEKGCQNGACIAACITNTDCGSDKICQNAICIFPPPITESTDLAGVYTVIGDRVITTTPGCSYSGDTNYDPLVTGSITIPSGLTPTSEEFTGFTGKTSVEACFPGGTRELYCDSNKYAHYVDVSCLGSCQNGACVEINCVEAIPGHNNVGENRINLILVGINYADMPTFISYVEDVIDYDGNNNGLLAIEPYKSNKDKFNFFYVNEMGALDTSGLAQFQYPAGIDSEISRLGALCPIINNKIVVTLINWDFSSNPDVVSFIPPTPGLFKVFVHEVGGHLIGGLNDEYLGRDLGDGSIYSGIIEQAYYSPNVICTYYEGEPRPWSCISTPASIADCEANAPWRDLIGNGCGQDGVVDCFEIDFGNPDCSSGKCVDRYVPLVGDLWGVEVSCNMGSTYPNYYRSTKISLMATMLYGPFSFGASNERIICKNIKNVIGSVGGICDELCLDGCPSGQRCVQGACQTA